MAHKKRKSTRSGTFLLSPGREVFGELTLAGKKSLLYLHDGQYIHTRGKNSCITGVLLDQSKVTLIDCVSLKSGSRSGEFGTYHFDHIFPHFVVEGARGIDPAVQAIQSLYFRVDDEAALFDDDLSFGEMSDPESAIDQIIKSQTGALGLDIPVGPKPIVLYFAGRREIVRVSTLWGTISILHSPRHQVDGPGGVALKNRILIWFEFDQPLLFAEAISRSSKLVNFFGLVAGRPQNVSAVNVICRFDGEMSTTLKVRWSTPPRRNRNGESRAPDSFGILLDAVRKANEFSTVLSRWLDRQAGWLDARFRFFGCFAQQRRYSIDRLTGAANMFDVLPKSAIPDDCIITVEVDRARKNARDLFRALPDSPERSSVLGALGRVGQRSLKRKIRHRIAVVSTVLNAVENLQLVTDEAVDCRNYYVHGSERRFDYNQHFSMVVFFTDTLEFVFAVSDLIDAGWDANAWLSGGISVSHPFGRYLFAYPAQLKALKILLPKSSSDSRSVKR